MNHRLIIDRYSLKHFLMLGKDSHAGTEAIGINSSVKNRFSISKDSQTTANINFNMKS